MSINMEYDKIACVIVNYNDSMRTIRLVKSIIGYEIIEKIIVVDNCSTDDSLKNLLSYKNNKYVVVSALMNGGYGYGNNLGIRKAKEYNIKNILVANPDVVFDEKCVERMLVVMKSNTNCAIVGAIETYMGVSGWRYTSDFVDVLCTSILFNKLIKKRYYPQEYFEKADIVEVDVVPGCFLLLNADKMNEVGMYDEEFFLYEEEKVLYKKFIQKGYCSLVATDVSFEHQHVFDPKEKISKYLINKERLIESKYIFLKKYRKIKGVKLLVCKLFMKMTVLEMFLYASYLRIKSMMRLFSEGKYE